MKRKDGTGTEGLEPEEDEGPLNESTAHSEATSAIRRDNSLGSSKDAENDLIMMIRKKNGYESCNEGLTMRRYEDLSPGGSGDDAATLAVLKRITSLGNFKSGDYTISEEAARLAKKLIKKYRKHRSEFTRKAIHQITIAVLRRCWLDFGPARVRLQPTTLLEVLEGEGV